MDPPNGSEQDRKATQLSLARAAFKRIGACGTADKAALDAALAEIGSVMKQGHGNFRGWKGIRGSARVARSASAHRGQTSAPNRAQHAAQGRDRFSRAKPRHRFTFFFPSFIVS